MRLAQHDPVAGTRGRLNLFHYFVETEPTIEAQRRTVECLQKTTRPVLIGFTQGGFKQSTPQATSLQMRGNTEDR